MSMEKLKKLVLDNFPQAELKVNILWISRVGKENYIYDYDLQTIYHLSVFQEEHMNQLMYQLPLKDTWLPRVFHVMEREKGESNGDLEDYSVSQLTLDDVSK